MKKRFLLFSALLSLLLLAGCTKQLTEEPLTLTFPAETAVFTGTLSKDVYTGAVQGSGWRFEGTLTAERLLTGEGEMLRDIHTDEKMGEDSRIADAGHDTLPSTLDKAIDEISEQRKIIMKSQEQIDRLIAVIERMTDARNTT